MNNYLLYEVIKIPQDSTRIKLRRIKATILMLIVGTCIVSANNAFSQGIKLSFHLSNISIKQVVTEIEKNSDYVFAWADNIDNETTEKVSIDVNETTVEQILDKVLAGKPLSYRILDKQIIVYRDRTKTESKQVESAVLSVQQQNKRAISGIVTDTNGESIIGANILEKGTANGTLTDLNGRFSLEVSTGATLVISYVGYDSQEIAIRNQTALKISLAEDLLDLGEVVVVGYGTQKKADLTSSISILNPSEVLKAPGGITDALQGNLPGINVSGGKIRIRGTSSITGNTDPLWVVDGVIDGSVPNDDEIESIQVLKDAASAAIYGVRGANGVIVITTKQGKLGSPRISFNTYVGRGSPQKKLEMLNAHDYALYANELYYNASTPEAKANGSWNLAVPANSAKPSQPLADTDWWDEYFFPNVYQKYDLSVSGANETINYRLGVTYTADDRQNVPRNNTMQNVYTVIQGTKGRFSYGGRVQLGYINNRGTSLASLQNTLQLPSNEPVYDPNNIDVNRGYYQTGMGDGLDIPNQAFFIHEDRNKTKSYNGIGNVFGEVKLFDWLKFKTTYTHAFYSSNYQHFRPKFTLASGGGGGTQNYNLLETTTNGNARTTVEGLLSFDKTFGVHSLSGVVGVTSESYDTFSKGFAGRSQEQIDFGVENMFQDDVSASGSKSEEAYFSYLARVMYSYAGKYLVTANFRADESSKFAHGNRWGYFPSFSLGWRVSEEPWVKEATSDWLTNLKLRATLGWIGSTGGIGNYTYQPTVSTVGYAYTLGPQTDNSIDSNVPAPRPTSIANRDIRWETTRDAGFGFDIGILKNKLSFTFDYYNRNAYDMLLDVQLPASTGAGSSVVMNVGSMTNWGIEMQATWRDQIGKFSYTVSPNFSLYRNKVTKLGDTPYLSGGYIDFTASYLTRTTVGKPVAQFWGLKTDGLFKTDEEAAGYVNNRGERLQPSAAAGDLKYIDKDGDGNLTENDKTFIGSSIPAAAVGLNIAMAYKGFDFSMLWQGDLGVDVYNNYKQTLLAGRALHNQMALIKNSFRATDVTFTTGGGETITLPANTNTHIPRVVEGDPNENSTRTSDYFVENASYLRCNNITLGYTLPKALLSKWKQDNIRFYVGVKNPFTITNYSMFDPQVPNTGTTLDRGVDGRFYDFTGTFWSQREYFVGLQWLF